MNIEGHIWFQNKLKGKNNKKGVRRYEWIFNTGQFKEVNVNIWAF